MKRYGPHPTLVDARGLTLVLGGARSGKSAFAERIIEASGLSPVYLATGQAHDEEMAQRISHHRERRSEAWQTIEAPLLLVEALDNAVGPGKAVLVDCLTLWMGNLMANDADISAETDRLISAVREPAGMVVMVSNEVGLGIVPDNAMARAFRDHAGRLHQKLAAQADKVHLVVAGLATRLKP